jgi:hypothetical protein
MPILLTLSKPHSHNQATRSRRSSTTAGTAPYSYPSSDSVNHPPFSDRGGNRGSPERLTLVASVSLRKECRKREGEIDIVHRSTLSRRHTRWLEAKHGLILAE